MPRPTKRPRRQTHIDADLYWRIHRLLAGRPGTIPDWISRRLWPIVADLDGQGIPSDVVPEDQPSTGSADAIAAAAAVPKKHPHAARGRRGAKET